MKPAKQMLSPKKSKLPIRPSDRYSWDIVVFFAIGLAAFEIPYSAAFPSPESQNDLWNRDLTFDLFFAVIFGIDILLNALTTRPENHAGAYGYRHLWGVFQPNESPAATRKRAGFRTRTLTSIRETSWGYLTSWWFWIDLIAAIPWGLLLIVNEAQILSSVKVAVLPRLIRFLRFFRILKAGKALQVIRQAKSRFTGFGRIALSVLLLPWMIHLFACLYFAIEINTPQYEGAQTYFVALAAAVPQLLSGPPENYAQLSPQSQIVVWSGILIQVMVISTAIGSLTSQFIAWDLKPRDRAKDYREGHTLLMGWNRWGALLLEQLLSDDTGEDESIIIASDTDPETVWNAIRSSGIGGRYENRVFVTRCSVLSPDNLTELSIHTASKVILTDVGPKVEVSDETTGQISHGDLMTLQCLLASCRAIENYCPKDMHTLNPLNSKAVSLVASASSTTSAKALREGIPESLLTHSSIRIVDTSVIPRRVHAQLILDARLEPVFKDLVSYESGPEQGAEIYSYPIEAHHSGAYFDRWRMLDAPCIPIGFIDQDGHVCLNPPLHSKEARQPLGVGCKLLVLSADEHSLHTARLRPSYKLVPERSTDPAPSVHAPRNILLLDSGQQNMALMEELSKFIPEQSSITFSGPAPESGPTGSVLTSFCDDESTRASLIEVVERLTPALLKDVDTIAITPHVRDAETHDAIVYMALAQLYVKLGKADLTTPPQIILQLRGAPNTSLLEAYGNPCIFNPDQLVSNLMVQFADDVSRADVLTYLLNPTGSEIYLRDIGLYVSPEDSGLTFRHLRDRGSTRGETVIGWIDQDGQYKIATPDGDAQSTQNMTSLIVLDED